ncbi:MAG TPA: anti-sigma factor [Gemmatimonadales bacterium]|nr:anti-sigma factor [Gemmatimonadales bacterium]
MNPHDWYVENRAAFVARALESDEERTFREHLPRCEECLQEVSRLERELAWLGMGATPVAPRPGLTRRLTAAVLDRPRRWQVLLPSALAAAALLLAVGLGWQGQRDRRALETALAAREHRLMALTDTLSVLREAQAVTQANISMDRYRGGLVIFRDAVSHRWCVVVHGLPPAPAGSVYQFWFITTTGMVRSVEVDANPTHPAIMTVGMPGESAPVMGAALTVEPAVNRSSEPEGMQLAHVMF